MSCVAYSLVARIILMSRDAYSLVARITLMSRVACSLVAIWLNITRCISTVVFG